MNIIEAIKSGRKIKRLEQVKFMTLTNSNYGLVLVREPQFLDDYDSHTLTLSDILADDWEIEEEKKELSWEDIKLAIMKSLLEANPGHIKFAIEDVKHTLGFK